MTGMLWPVSCKHKYKYSKNTNTNTVKMQIQIPGVKQQGQLVVWLTRVVREMLAARRGGTADLLGPAPEEQTLTLKVLFDFCFRFGQGLP